MPPNAIKATTLRPHRKNRDGRFKQVSVALLDRHLIFRQGLEALMRQTQETTLVGSLSKPEDVAVCLNQVNLDVLILELDFPGYDLLREISCWSKGFPKVSLVVLTGYNESLFGERSIRAGARGFLEKSCGLGVLLDALTKIGEGKLAVSPTLEALLLSRFSGLREEAPMPEIDALSDRELLALTLVGQGLSTGQIADSMQVSPKTVGSYKERIKEKLGLSDSLQLAQYASRQVAVAKRESV